MKFSQQILSISGVCLLQAIVVFSRYIPDDPLTSDPDWDLTSDALEEVTGNRELHIPVSVYMYPEYITQEHSSRQKRSAPSGKQPRFRQKARRRPELSGDVVFSARRAFRLYFDFDYGALSRSEVLSAHVVVYQTKPRRMTKRNRKSRSAAAAAEPQDAPERVARDVDGSEDKKSLDKSARVIMHQTIDSGEEFGTTRATDMKMVSSRSRGWLAFDVTSTLKDWVAVPSSNQGLELWVVSARPGRRAARTALQMRFVKPNSHRAVFRPELVVKLKPAKADSNNLTT